MFTQTQNLNYAQLEYRHYKMKKVFGYVLMFAALFILFAMPDFAYAAGGLEKAASAVDNFNKQIKPVIRVLAIAAFILAGAGYMMSMIDKSTFIKIVAGIVIVGSASELVGLVWSE